MATTLISPEEYLTASYEPDAEYVDGAVVERNVGTFSHSWLQTAIVNYMYKRRKIWGIIPLVECRIRLGPRLYRIPDICALPASAPREEVPSKPPLFTIEILSPEDSFIEVRRKAEEYLAFGVASVWTIDPQQKVAYEHDQKGFQRVEDNILRVSNSAIAIDLNEVFSEL